MKITLDRKGKTETTYYTDAYRITMKKALEIAKKVGAVSVKKMLIPCGFNRMACFFFKDENGNTVGKIFKVNVNEDYIICIKNNIEKSL